MEDFVGFIVSTEFTCSTLNGWCPWVTGKSHLTTSGTVNLSPAPSGLSSEMLANKLNLLTVCINTVSYGLWQVKVEQETYSASSAMGEGLVVRWRQQILIALWPGSWVRLYISCFRARILIAADQENNYITWNAGWQRSPGLCLWVLSECSRPAAEMQDVIYSLFFFF